MKHNHALVKARTQNQKSSYVLLILFALLLAAALGSFTMGRYNVSLQTLFGALWDFISGSQTSNGDVNRIVLLNIRLPRILAAVLIGLALSVSGAAYQGTFKNPMVSPDILGASAGSAFGAALGILCSLNFAGVQITAFAFGLFAVIITYTIGKTVSRGSSSTLTLVLAGMVVSTLFSSFIALTKYVANPYTQLPAITFWLMGGLSSVQGRDVLFMAVPMLIGIIPLFLLRWKINLLSLGDEEASALGVNPRLLRAVVIACSTMLTASAVSVGGQIGWVGLVIPHLARMMVGPNYKKLIPATALLGGVYLLLVDDIARNLLIMEIPLGILTSIIGAPFFIVLLLRGKKGWV